MDSAGISKKLLQEGFYCFKEKASPGKCWVKHCRKEAQKDRCMCARHYKKRWRALNPEMSTFCELRWSAKRRKIDFDLTYDYFRGLCDAYQYFQKRDAEEWRDCLTIDRIDPSRGYVKGNLQIMTLSENVAKGNKERFLPEHVQDMLRRKRDETNAIMKTQESRDPDVCPF